jgi:hypothetical protein
MGPVGPEGTTGVGIISNVTPNPIIYMWNQVISGFNLATGGAVTGEIGVTAFPNNFYSTLPTLVSFNNGNTGKALGLAITVNCMIKNNSTFTYKIHNSNSSTIVSDINVNFVAIGH